jgi:hypothetical protein
MLSINHTTLRAVGIAINWRTIMGAAVRMCDLVVNQDVCGPEAHLQMVTACRERGLRQGTIDTGPAPVVKLVDTSDLKSAASEKGRAGSIPARGTIEVKDHHETRQRAF